MVIDIGRELAEASEASTPMHYRRLLALGVRSETVAELRGLNGLGWGIARASPGKDGLYEPGEGEQHLVLPIAIDHVVVDLVAFRSATPDVWALRSGLGWALGVERGLERYTWGEPVILYETPLDWLRADKLGLCVLDWTAPELRYLRTLPEIECASERLAAVLRRHLRRDPHFPNITVAASTEAQRRAV